MAKKKIKCAKRKKKYRWKKDSEWSTRREKMLKILLCVLY